MSDNWQQDGFNAFQQWAAGGNDDTPDVVEAPQHEPTPDADDGFEDFLVGSFLARDGLSWETASNDDVLNAALEADAWQAKAHARLGQIQVEHEDAVSIAQEQAAVNVMNELVEAHGENATHVVEQVMAGVENGLDFDTALAQATAAGKAVQAEVDQAEREHTGQALGYEKGMKAAFANRRAASNAPDYTPTQQPRADVGLTADMSNAIGRLAAQQRARGDVRAKAKEIARS
jgi:hypothetical protein